MKTVIEKYIDEQTEDVQVILTNIREMILKEFPEVEEKFSWNMPQIYYKGSVVWFANFKAHIGLFPEPQAIVDFQDRLVGYKTSKGGIQFKKNEEIPYELILDIVRYNINRNLEKLQ